MKLVKKITALLIAAAVMATTVPQVYADDIGYVHAEGTRVIGTDGRPLQIKGMALGCNVWDNTSEPPKYHHTEDTYRELSELGFNSVRLYLNYRLFENDDTPYEYLQSGFDWLDTNISWAKKHGIGIILNMHYPQGGYQSQGNGSELWSEPENLNRLTALWSAIAEHCADEPTIWGYGLVNEPYPPLIGNEESTVRYYTNAVRNMTAAIRKVSPHQAIFAERMINIGGTDWSYLTVDNSFPLIDDDNVIYEFHFYEPFQLTHSVTFNKPNPPQYPVVDLYASEYESTWVGTERAAEVSHNNGWSFFKTEPVTATDDYNVGILAVNAGGMSDGAVYFDDLKVTEISDDGERVIFSYNFDSESEIDCFYKWTADGSGVAEYSRDGGRAGGGAYKVSGTDMDLTGGADRFILEEGKQYVVSGYAKKLGDVQYYSPRLDLAKATRFVTVDKAYLEEMLMDYISFSEKHNVPLYLGEFGCCNDAFRDGSSAPNWVGDIIDICLKHGIGFNYHAYHEDWFGFYRSSGYVYPAPENRNDPLADVFSEKLKTTATETDPTRIIEMLKGFLPFI